MPELRHRADAPQAARGVRPRIAREGQRLECHYCGYRRTVPARCPKCDSEHLYYLGAGSQQGEERLTEIFPIGAHRAHGSRHGARTARSGAAAGATALRRDQPAGRHADDRQGARHSRHHAGGRGGLRPRAVDAGLSRRGARLSADDAGVGPRGARRTARPRGGADLLSRPLRDPGGQQRTTTRALWNAN